MALTAACVDFAGSPAWAGIDPHNRAKAHATLRFPRVGGDRPTPPLTKRFALTVPPRGRG